MRVDCHLHTMWSGDSTTTPEELAAAVSATAIDVVCITDHGTIRGAQRLAAELDCDVVVGQEQRTPEGELIGLFLSERLAPGSRSARQTALEIRVRAASSTSPIPSTPCATVSVRGCSSV